MPISHMLLSELFPSDIRALSIGLTQSAALSMGSVHIKLFPTIMGTFQVSFNNSFSS
jgi:hypothetical protein